MHDPADPRRRVSRTKHPASAMCLGVVGSDGKALLVWFDPSQKVDARTYQQVLEAQVRPWLEANYSGRAYIWQQDGAPAHTARTTQAYLKDAFHEFWPSDFWPPSSPDLNPLDYSIWARMEAEACRTPHKNVAELKAAVDQAWANMDEMYIMKVCKKFRTRLEAVVDKNGGYID